MAATVTARRRYTVAEFVTLVDDLELAGVQDRFELIEGELVAHASPDNPHMHAAMAFLMLLLDAQRAGYGAAGGDVVSAHTNWPPDIRASGWPDFQLPRKVTCAWWRKSTRVSWCSGTVRDALRSAPLGAALVSSIPRVTYTT